MSIYSKYQRLASMNSSELVTRIKQEFTKRFDSLMLFQPRLLQSSYNTPLEHESVQTGRFFFDQEDIPQRIQLICKNVLDFEIYVLDQAEQIMNHQFPLLGYGPLDYGKEIDWQLDIINGKRAPLKPWPKINYLDFHEVGDTKVTWELSRHQFLVTLAKAWLLTGEERFIRKLVNIYYDWHEKNPYPLGVNWASSLEVAFRSLSWIWVRELLRGCKFVSKLHQDIIDALAFNARYIQRYLSTYFSPNTHLQGEAVALFFIGTLCSFLPKAADWRKKGWDILLDHALTKVLEDGAYFEQSTYYHVYALDFFLHARVLAECNGSPFPSNFDDVLKKMLVHLSFLCQAGPPPRFGDDDGGRVFDGRRNQAEHLSDPLVIGAALYGVDTYKQPGLQVTEEMLWLLGEKGLRAFSICPEWKSSGKSAVFPHTGIYIVHAGGSSRSQMVLDAGPLGGGSGGHGHADALSLTLNLNGKPLLADPGACNYIGPASDRGDFRLTRAHNTVMVDGLPQAEPRTPFSWLRWPEVKVEVIAFTPEFDFITASHDGYTRLQSPVTHCRTLFTLREDFWFVLDQLISDGSHDYALHWHLAPDSHVKHQPVDERIVVIEREGSKLYILTLADEWFQTIKTGWFSPAYGVKQATPVISLIKKAQGKETIATVLWVATHTNPIPRIDAINNPYGIPAYRLTNGTNCSFFIFGDGISIMDIEGWESDARFLYSILDADGRPSRVISVQSKIVRYFGETFLESKERVDHFVW